MGLNLKAGERNCWSRLFTPGYRSDPGNDLSGLCSQVRAGSPGVRFPPCAFLLDCCPAGCDTLPASASGIGNLSDRPPREKHGQRGPRHTWPPQPAPSVPPAHPLRLHDHVARGAPSTQPPTPSSAPAQLPGCSDPAGPGDADAAPPPPSTRPRPEVVDAALGAGPRRTFGRHRPEASGLRAARAPRTPRLPFPPRGRRGGAGFGRRRRSRGSLPDPPSRPRPRMGPSPSPAPDAPWPWADLRRPQLGGRTARAHEAPGRSRGPRV